MCIIVVHGLFMRQNKHKISNFIVLGNVKLDGCLLILQAHMRIRINYDVFMLTGFK